MKMKYKKGDIIEWCNEKFKILEVHPNGDSGKVCYLDGTGISNNFRFNYCGEVAKIIN